MLESSFRNLVAGRRFPDQRVAQLRRFTTSLIEQGYVEAFLHVSSSKNLSAHPRGSVRRASGLVLVGYTEVNFLRV